MDVPDPLPEGTPASEESTPAEPSVPQNAPGPHFQQSGLGNAEAFRHYRNHLPRRDSDPLRDWVRMHGGHIGI